MAKKPPAKPHKLPLHRSLIAKSWAMFRANPITVGATLFGVFIGIPTAVTTWQTYIYPFMPALHFQVDNEVARLERHLKKIEGNVKVSSDVPASADASKL